MLCVALVGLTAPARAEPGRVLACHDGDTCHVLTAEGIINVRMAGLDAPEDPWPGRWVKQPGADEARDALWKMIGDKTVDLECTGQHSYRRDVCRTTVRIDGNPVDVSEALVSEGWAWSAIQFEPAHDRDQRMPDLQAAAQAAGRGLWGLQAGRRIPPWEWRHGGR